MILHRKKGATLGLVAVCVFVVIVLGVGFFILSKIIGGEREVANATDAGVLTVARKALSPTLVNVALTNDADSNPVNDFIGIDISKPGPGVSTGKIDMLGLNRVIAQAIIVALNAEDLNTPLATTHAQSVAIAARNVANGLRGLLHNAPTLNEEFNKVAHQNNTKMWQGNPVTLVGNVNSAFMRPGLSSNVFFPASLNLPVNLPSNMLNKQTGAVTNNGSNYMAGYTNFSVPAGGGSVVQIAAVPIFPQTKPHLIDIGEFDRSTNDPVGTYLPPNSFKANSRAMEGNAGNLGGAIACAIVGALDRDFPASVPRGYVRFVNGPDANSTNAPVTNPVVDGTNDIFNNELWPPSGLSMTDNNVFATQDHTGLMQEWADYNNANPPKPPSEQPAFPGGVFKKMPDGSAATLADMKGIKSVPAAGCDTMDGWNRPECHFAGGLVPGTLPFAAACAYNRYSTQGNNANNCGYTNIEWMKGQLLEQRAGGAECVNIGTPNGPSGMKKFSPTGCYNTPAYPVNFGQPGSPYDYLEMIATSSGTCVTDIYNQIHRRMTEVDPSITLAQVKAALASQSLQMGQTLVLYSPGPGQIMLSPMSPGQYFSGSTTNDGQSSIRVKPCDNSYAISETMVNAAAGTGTGPTCGVGDANYHYAPFTDNREDPNNPIKAMDKATWTPASGWRNLLGDVKFENSVNHGGSWCKPN